MSSGRSAAGATLACASLTGWPTASKVHFVTYQIDSNSNPVAGTQLDCYGIVSGSNLTLVSVVDGTDTGNSVGDVVEMLPTAAWGQDLADALMNEHKRTGVHAAITADSINIAAAGAVTTNTISEKTADSGVTIDGLNVKNSQLNTDGSVIPSNLATGTGTSWVWQTWAPTLTNLSGGTQTYAKYTQIGKTVHFRFKYTLAGAGVSGLIGFTLPVAIASGYSADDSETADIKILFRDTGTGVFPGFATFGPSNRIDLNAIRTDANYAFIASTTSLIPHTWATTDVITVAGNYEAA